MGDPQCSRIVQCDNFTAVFPVPGKEASLKINARNVQQQVKADVVGIYDLKELFYAFRVCQVTGLYGYGSPELPFQPGLNLT